MSQENCVPHQPGAWIDPNTGEEVLHHALMAEMAAQNVVLLGETHDRFDIHRWQLHVAAGLYAHRKDIALGFEMFPHGVQPVLEEWVGGRLTQDAFLEKVEWKKVWGFDPELYLPLFHFCREFSIPMYALNCRRELVTEVGKLGWEAIAVEDRDGLTPAKPAAPEYHRYILDLLGPEGIKNMPRKPEDDKPEDGRMPARFMRAQQTWDRAFACNIAKVLADPNPPLMIGIIGRGHLEYGHGTPFQLEDLDVEKVSVLLPSDKVEVDLIKHAGIGDAVFRLEHEQAKADG